MKNEITLTGVSALGCLVGSPAMVDLNNGKGCTTSRVERIEHLGHMAVGGYCVEIETLNSVYRLQDVNKLEYFKTLEWQQGAI